MQVRAQPLSRRFTAPLLSLLLALLLVSWQLESWAHGMNLAAAPAAIDGQWIIRGQLSYSDDSVAAGNYIQVENLSRIDFPVLALKTGADGSFQLPGLLGDSYRVSALGDEGHTTATEFTLAPPQVEEAPHDDGWPIYVILALLLLASLLPAYWLRVR